MTRNKIVFTTTGSHEEARKIAGVLIERRLAACVNIVPQIESIYRWKEKIEHTKECLLIIKTTEAAFGGLRDAIKEQHSYELPECLCIAIDSGSEEYLKWINESTSSAS